MYVKRIVLENVRGFPLLDFELERADKTYAGWTVVTGDNGSGKSALLKAVAMAILGPTIGRILEPSLRGWVRIGSDQAVIAVQLVTSHGDDSFTVGGRLTHQPFWAELQLDLNGAPEPELQPGNKYRRKGKTPVRGPWADNPVGWFSCGYGPFRRLYGASSDATRLMVGPGRVSRFVSTFREDAALTECETWLKDLHNRSRNGRKEDEAVLAVVMRVLSDDFLQHGMTIERLDVDGLWLRDQSGVVLPLVDMGDGYRAALAILTDICRHMVDTYGREGLVDEEDGHVVVKRTGVVLIDEIDAHLHPEWQRQIGFWLKKRFPRVQFIVTSHSPIICQAAERGGLYRLTPPGSGDPPFRLTDGDCERVVRAKPDSILVGPAFGLEHTRSPRVVAARRRHATLKAKGAAGALNSGERRELKQLLLFIDEEE